MKFRILNLLGYYYYFLNGHIPSVWYLGSYSVADAFNLRQYNKADSFQGENREFFVAFPLIHHTSSWTFHQWFFFPRCNSSKSQKSYSSLLCGLGVFGVVNQKFNIGIFSAIYV